MARILFITPYFPPEKGAAQTRIGETALKLVRRGHEVTVLTTLPNYPKGFVFPGYERGQRREENWNGVRVIRVWSYISPDKGFRSRVLGYLSFGLLAPFQAFWKVGRPDIMIVSSPPLFVAFAGRILRFLKRRPYIFIVADIWPESAVAARRAAQSRVYLVRRTAGVVDLQTRRASLGADRWHQNHAR